MISTVKKVKEEIGEYRKERLSAKKPYKFKGSRSSLNPASSNHTSGFRHDRTPLSTRLRLAGRRRSSRLQDKEVGGHQITVDDEGLDYKAKLIGIQDVEEARGDYMCQNAMQACKTSLKRSGHRKQRIWFNLSRSGFKIKERASKITLFNFPINKISFIAKDITDDRAFGFVYEGLEKKKYKFYGIKTEQQAERVVLDIRDLFHMVYEATLKKNQENKPAFLGNKETQLPTSASSPDKYVRISSTAAEVRSISDQREYEEIPTTYAKIMERTKSASEISKVDRVFAESNDLINFNHQTDGPSKDPFDFTNFGSTIQSANNDKSLMNDLAVSRPTPAIAQLDQISSRNQSIASHFEDFHQTSSMSSENEIPSIPPRSQPITSTILPRPESAQKNLSGSEGKLLPPPLPKRNKNFDQATSQTENKDPFADDFFA